MSYTMSGTNSSQSHQSQHVEGSDAVPFLLDRVLLGKGRMRRTHFGLSAIAFFVSFVTLYILMNTFLTMSHQMTGVAGLLVMLPALLFGILLGTVVWFMFSATIRRLHDIGLPGWFSLLLLIGIGSLLVILLVLIRTQSDNRYGPIPPPTSPGYHLAAIILLSIAAFVVFILLIIGISSST